MGFFSDDSESISSSDEENNAVDLCQELRWWSIEANATHSQIRSLLKRLKPIHPELPSDPRTLLDTPTFTQVKLIGKGSYVHIGLEKGLLSRLKFGTVNGTTNLGLDINIDGLPLSDSTSVDCWPILARCRDLISSTPFCVGVYCGPCKPESFELYLEDYIKEAKKLLPSGSLFEDVKFNVYIRCYICDAPARAFVKCITYHTGYSACERCLCEVDHDGKRVLYESRVSTPRTDELFDRQEDENHHRGASPLKEIPGTLFVTMFILDHMHLIFQGVLKRFLHFLLEGKSNARLRASEILSISSKLSRKSQCKPQEFSRSVGPLNAVSRWKATELRLFLLYVSIVVFFIEIPEEVYSLLLLFHVGCRIIFSPELVKHHEYVDYAEGLFEAFVKHCADKTVCGPSFVVYNPHSLLHVCDDVRAFGVVTDNGAFPFENYLKTIKSLVKSGVHVPQQIARRLAERHNFIPTPRGASATLSPVDWIDSKQEYRSISCESYMLTPFTTQNSFFSFGHPECLGQVKRIVRERERWVSCCCS